MLAIIFPAIDSVIPIGPRAVRRYALAHVPGFSFGSHYVLWLDGGDLP